MEYIIVDYFSSEKTRHMIFKNHKFEGDLVADFSYNLELAMCAPPLLQKKCKKG